MYNIPIYYRIGKFFSYFVLLRIPLHCSLRAKSILTFLHYFNQQPTLSYTSPQQGFCSVQAAAWLCPASFPLFHCLSFQPCRCFIRQTFQSRVCFEAYGKAITEMIVPISGIRRRVLFELSQCMKKEKSSHKNLSSIFVIKLYELTADQK